MISFAYIFVAGNVGPNCLCLLNCWTCIIHDFTNGKVGTAFIPKHEHELLAGGPFIATSYDYDAPLDEYGLLRQPKWGDFNDLHRAIKLCEPTLVSAYPTMTTLGKYQGARVSNQTLELLLHFLQSLTHWYLKILNVGNALAIRCFVGSHHQKGGVSVCHGTWIPCFSCKKTFVMERQMSNHSKGAHNFKPDVTSICGIGFKRKADLEMHKCPMKNQDVQCCNCGRTCKWKEALGLPKLCKACSPQFE